MQLPWTASCNIEQGANMTVHILPRKGQHARALLAGHCQRLAKHLPNTIGANEGQSPMSKKQDAASIHDQHHKFASVPFQKLSA